MKYLSELVDALVNDILPSLHDLEQRFDGGVSIYGAGFVGEWACRYLQSKGVLVSNFIDRDPKKAGTHICGIPVVLPDSSVLGSVNCMLIAARHAVNAVKIQMANHDFAALSFDGYFVAKNYRRLVSIREHFLSDAKSVETFNAILTAMLTGSLEGCLDVMEKDMYFSLPKFSGTFDEIFVDAGAFVGDTVERFIWENLGTFRHIYAFEPGVRQFKAMEKRVARLSEEWAFGLDSVSLVKGGLSSGSGKMTCTFVDDMPLRHGLAGRDTEGVSDDVDCVDVFSLDDFLDGSPVTFIKADVEGMEMELLRGAKETIARNKPKLAICVYHYPSDLYEVAEYIRALVPEYRFSLRQHAPILGDYVLYCYL